MVRRWRALCATAAERIEDLSADLTVKFATARVRVATADLAPHLHDHKVDRRKAWLLLREVLEKRQSR